MWVMRVEVTLSVQDWVCDGSCGVSVGVGFVDVVVVGGVWHFCWWLMWLCGRFRLSGWVLVG